MVMTELNLWLDSYDDIYSDFDSRHYLKRRISDDFLHELRIEIKDREHVARDLVLLLPPERRDETAEKIIAASLTAFFSGQFLFHRDRCRSKLNKGMLLFASGIITMLFNSWISYQYAASFPVIALKVLMEPAGWFLLWAALDFLFYDFRGLKRERDFFKELKEMHIHFRSS
jgi:hypothetical protein